MDRQNPEFTKLQAKACRTAVPVEGKFNPRVYDVDRIQANLGGAMGKAQADRHLGKGLAI